jgi:hypothetical protein
MSLPCPQALIKRFHASHYTNGLYEVVRRDYQRSDQNAHICHPPLRAYDVHSDSHEIFLLAPWNEADNVDDRLDLARPFTQLVLASFG